MSNMDAGSSLSWLSASTRALPPPSPGSRVSNGPANPTLSTSNGQRQGLSTMHSAQSSSREVKEGRRTASACLSPPSEPPRQPIVKNDPEALARTCCKPQGSTSVPPSDQQSRLRHPHRSPHDCFFTARLIWAISCRTGNSVNARG